MTPPTRIAPMSVSTENLLVIADRPSWYRPTELLKRAPLLIEPGDDRDRLLTAVLSDSGRQLIFEHGRMAFRQRLIDSCVSGSDQSAIAEIEWIFVDEETLDASNRDNRLQALICEQKNPCLPDIVAFQSSADDLEYLFHIPADLVWFDGHFPDEPILPAVVQVDWAIRFGRWLGFDPDRFAGFARLKFMAMIQPGMLVRLSLVTKGDDLKFAYESAAGLHSKGTVKFSGQYADDQGSGDHRPQLK
jgi:3-hydroxymyristoyl/3-hydroxydecanoyl-(acyl carrier protein) dehydratase